MEKLQSCPSLSISHLLKSNRRLIWETFINLYERQLLKSEVVALKQAGWEIIRISPRCYIAMQDDWEVHLYIDKQGIGSKTFHY